MSMLGSSIGGSSYFENVQHRQQAPSVLAGTSIWQADQGAHQFPFLLLGQACKLQQVSKFQMCHAS